MRQRGESDQRAPENIEVGRRYSLDHSLGFDDLVWKLSHTYRLSRLGEQFVSCITLLLLAPSD